MKCCLVCNTSSSIRWRGNYCNSCYLKEWRSNNTKNIIDYDESLDRRFAKAKRIAKRRDLEWALSIEEYQSLAYKECFYCKNNLGKKVSTGVGLDRIDNTKGYIAGNIVPCCKSCNTIRSDLLSMEEMIEVVRLVLKLRNI